MFKKIPFRAAELTEGQDLGVTVGMATAHCTIGLSMVHGRVGRATPKAVRIDNDKGQVWLPRRALVAGFTTPEMASPVFDLARWFHPDARQARTIQRMEEHSVLSA